jgi:hypothetical protein
VIMGILIDITLWLGALAVILLLIGVYVENN